MTGGSPCSCPDLVPLWSWRPDGLGWTPPTWWWPARFPGRWSWPGKERSHCTTPTTTVGFHSFANSAPKPWNALPQTVREAKSKRTKGFKKNAIYLRTTKHKTLANQRQIPWQHSADIWKPTCFLNDLHVCSVSFFLLPVSYTHLTLPTMAVV